MSTRNLAKILVIEALANLTPFALLIAIIFIATACGTAPENSQPLELEDAKFDKTEEKEVVIEHRKVGNEYALAVNDTADMPECTKSNSRQLVYVKNLDKFYSCEDDETWYEIDLQGEPGPQGPAGDDGENILAENMWEDPVTGDIWFVGGAAHYYTVFTLLEGCSDGWDMPTKDELDEAFLHGLDYPLNQLEVSWTKAWTKSQGSDSDHQWTVERGTGIPREVDVTDTNQATQGIVCISEE